jgi:hypothetical protein
MKKTISLAIAQWWMGKMGYQWEKTPSGQYVDGHKHEDIVNYCQNVFIPTWNDIEY